MKLKFSIIVPAYNLSKFIIACLDSIVNQDLEKNEYEVLIINDGSTDTTASIVEEYTKKHQNFFLINKDNGGVSSARNLGLKKAKGEYIFFVDGDDFLCDNILGKIYSLIKNNNLDIARFGYNYATNFILRKDKPRVLEKSEKIIQGLEFLKKHDIDDFFPWSFVFSREYLSKHNLKFNNELSFSEDKEFIIKSMVFDNNFMNFELIHYNYNVLREDSATAVYSKKHLKDLIKSNLIIYKLSESTSLNYTLQEYIRNNSLKSLELSYYSLTRTSIWNKFWEWYEYLKASKQFKKIGYSDSKKIFMVRKMPFLFYLRYYFPRSIFHRFLK